MVCKFTFEQVLTTEWVVGERLEQSQAEAAEEQKS